METVASLFGGSPFGTPIGQRIEKATGTEVGLAGENWALNMEICDLINGSEDGPRDAVRAIRKLLQLHTGKDQATLLSTLTVLETCVKNCGRRFHVVVCTKDFIQELVRVISPKNDTSTEVQEKVLTLIQTWADAFQKHPDLQGVSEVYQELKLKGVEFPMTNLDTMAPVVTPHNHKQVVQCQPSTSSAPKTVRRDVEESFITVADYNEPPQPEVQPPLSLNKEQKTKLRRELEIVEGNMSVLKEMLDELNPGHESPKDLQLLRALYTTCRTMQVRIVELLDRIASDKITERLLKVNDDLNNMFIRYECYDKNRKVSTLSGMNPKETSSHPNSSRDTSSKVITSKVAISRVAPVVPVAPTTSRESSAPAAAAAAAPSSLIDFDQETVAASSAMKNLGLTDGKDTDDFDMFAQLRTTTYEDAMRSSAPYGDPGQLATSLGKVTQQRQQEGGVSGNEIFQGVLEEDIQDMEAWLESKTSGFSAGLSSEGDGTLSPAMKDYLQRRAGGNPVASGSKNLDDHNLLM